VAARRGAQQPTLPVIGYLNLEGRVRKTASKFQQASGAKLVSGTATNRYLRLGNVSDREHTIL